MLNAEGTMDSTDRKVQLQNPFEEAEQLSTTASDSDDEFEDATSDTLETIDLAEAFKDCEQAIKMFFCNDVQGAMDLMMPNAGISLYHSLGSSIFAFIPAILTFDSNRIAEALASIKNCIRICNRNRKSRGIVETLGSMIRKPDYTLYSDQEAHAELCYAEALLLQAALTVVEGEDMRGLIRGTFKVRTCHSTYKRCSDMLKVKKWESEDSREHFQSGVQLGMAAFNLIISMLPAKFVALLEFVGYSGNRLTKIRDSLDSELICIKRKYYGLSELQKGSQSPGLRRVLCDLTLLAFHLVLQPFVGGQGDYKISNDILDNALQEYPDSVWFLVFKARFEYLQGNLEDATRIYLDTSNKGQDGFSEFKHLCYWELMWIHALRHDFRSSTWYASRLIELSAWSRTTCTYVKAVLLMQLGSQATREDLKEVQQLMRDAESYKVRIAGKSLPMEKFVIRRCARYHNQQEKLILPYLELLCIWNLMPMLRKNISILQQMLKNIEATREKVTSNPQAWCGFDKDNAALLHYMEGCVLSAIGLPRQAIQSFEEAVSLKKEIKEDHFVVPYAIAEMAMCYFSLENKVKTKELLSEARKKYSGYALESRLHFRVHARLQMLRETQSPNHFNDKLPAM